MDKYRPNCQDQFGKISAIAVVLNVAQLNGWNTKKNHHPGSGNPGPERQAWYILTNKWVLAVKIIMLQSTDPERLIHKEGSREDALISLGRGIRIDFMGGLEHVEREQKGSGRRWRERILAEMTGIGGYICGPRKKPNAM